MFSNEIFELNRFEADINVCAVDFLEKNISCNFLPVLSVGV